MWIELLPLILGGGGLLGGIAAMATVFVQRRNTKDTVKVDHGQVVLEGYNELVGAVQNQIDRLTTHSAKQDEKIQVLSVTIESQEKKIDSLKIELRDRDDQIRLLTLDRDDLIALVVDPSRPNLRTI